MEQEPKKVEKMFSWDDRDFTGTPTDPNVAGEFIYTRQGYYKKKRGANSPEEARRREELARNKKLARAKARVWMKDHGFPWLPEDNEE